MIDGLIALFRGWLNIFTIMFCIYSLTLTFKNLSDYKHRAWAKENNKHYFYIMTIIVMPLLLLVALVALVENVSILADVI